MGFARDIYLPASIQSDDTSLHEQPTAVYPRIGGDRQRAAGFQRVKKGALGRRRRATSLPVGKRPAKKTRSSAFSRGTGARARLARRRKASAFR